MKWMTVCTRSTKITNAAQHHLLSFTPPVIGAALECVFGFSCPLPVFNTSAPALCSLVIVHTDFSWQNKQQDRITFSLSLVFLFSFAHTSNVNVSSWCYLCLLGVCIVCFGYWVKLIAWISVCPSLCLSVCLFFSRSVYLSLFVSLCLTMSLSFSLFRYRSVSPYFSLSLCLSVDFTCLSVSCLSLCLSAWLSLYLVCLSISFSLCLSLCLFVFLSVSLFVCPTWTQREHAR